MQVSIPCHRLVMIRSGSTTLTGKFHYVNTLNVRKGITFKLNYYFYLGLVLLTAYTLTGSVAEWSKALVLGTSLFGGASSNLAAIKH